MGDEQNKIRAPLSLSLSLSMPIAARDAWVIFKCILALFFLFLFFLFFLHPASLLSPQSLIAQGSKRNHRGRKNRSASWRRRTTHEGQKLVSTLQEKRESREQRKIEAERKRKRKIATWWKWREVTITSLGCPWQAVWFLFFFLSLFFPASPLLALCSLWFFR